MRKLDCYIQSITSKNNYSFYLSLARVFAALMLLKKLMLQWKLIPLLYMGSDFFEPVNKEITGFFIRFDSYLIRDNIHIFLGIFVLFLFLLLFGLGRNFTALIIYFLYDILMKLCPQILNGGDNFFKFILLYLVFADSFQYFSLEKYKENQFAGPRNFLSNLAGLCVCIHLCFIYFISGIHKLHADLWFNGVATYYIFGSDRFNGTPFNAALSKNTVFVVFSTYGTILIELFYPVLVWVKKFTKVMVVLAAMLHFGIALFMMLYDFQAVFIFAQGFFFTNEQWLRQYGRVMAFSNRVRQKFKGKLAVAA